MARLMRGLMRGKHCWQRGGLARRQREICKFAGPGPVIGACIDYDVGSEGCACRLLAANEKGG